jgi:Ala-tRNA(Pro) deacylase
MDEIQKVCDLLESLDIEYTLLRHEIVHTLEECAAVDAALGGKHCKNLFLTTRNGSALFLVLIAAYKQVRTAELSKQLGVSRLSFCAADTLKAVLNLYPGAVNPFALMADTQKKVRLAIDEDLKGDGQISFHPNSNEATVRISYCGFEKFLAHIGREPVYIHI